MRSTSSPFALAPESAVEFLIPWHIHTPAGSTPLAEDLSGWDYQAVLNLHAELRVDVELIRRTCHLGIDATLDLVVCASSSSTKMRGPVAIAPITTDPLELQVALCGQELGGRLGLDTLIVLSDVDRADELAPSDRGSIVWKGRQTTWLEGEGARFPTEVADLGAAPFFTSGALWSMEIDTNELDSAALAGVRLILNDRHPMVVRMLAGEDGPEVAAAMSVLRWDVARQIVNAALDAEEFIERDGHFEEGTLGALLSGVLSVVWPHDTTGSIQQLRATDPSRFERDLQNWMELLGG